MNFDQYIGKTIKTFRYLVEGAEIQPSLDCSVLQSIVADADSEDLFVVVVINGFLYFGKELKIPNRLDFENNGKFDRDAYSTYRNFYFEQSKLRNKRIQLEYDSKRIKIFVSNGIIEKIENI